ncbi:MAG: sulfatase-like hydrolase/transferase [Pirellulaceae bacterium]
MLRGLTGLLFASLVSQLLCTAVLPAAEKPNVLVVVADDLGWADVGFHGSKLPTPNLDKLAGEGVVLDQHYVAPVCTPTRAALLSGRYWSRFGNTAPSNTRVYPFGTVTLASALKSVGYATAITGKWHLGSMPEWGPTKFGFDHSYGSLAGGTGPWNHRYKMGDYTHTWHRNDELIEEEGHVTDLLADEAVKFLSLEHEKPFFLYVPFTAVHHPLQEPEVWLAAGQKADPKRPQYAASVMHMDDAVGRLLTALERSGKQENTIVVFFSDNGGMPPGPADRDNARYPGEYPQGELLGDNTPLRGYKTQLYEGGIRVPAVIRWPAELKPGKATTPVHVVDWMPTLTALAGYQPQDDLKWDGRSAWPAIRGESTSADAVDRVLYWDGPGHRSGVIRQGDWKLVVHHASGGDRIELFDLANDPQEKHDLADKQAERVVAMRKLLAAERAKDGDAVVKP